MQTKEIFLDLRKKNELTQDEMAGKLMVTRQAVSRWENGETVPNIDTLKMMSGIFGLSINELLGHPQEIGCQSCGMPLNNAEDFGTENDGGTSVDYCCHCYQKGDFSAWAKNMTLQDMIDFNVNFCVEHGIYKTLEESRAECEKFYPTLKRWKTS